MTFWCYDNSIAETDSWRAIGWYRCSYTTNNTRAAPICALCGKPIYEVPRWGTLHASYGYKFETQESGCGSCLNLLVAKAALAKRELAEAREKTTTFYEKLFKGR